MKSLAILKSSAFKDIFNKYFLLDEGVFINDDKSQISWCFMDEDLACPCVSEYNDLIKNSYIFHLTSNGYFALFYSLVKNNYSSVIFVDTEGEINIIGSSIFDFVFNLEEYAFKNHHQHAHENVAAFFYKNCQMAFGDIPPVVDLDTYIAQNPTPELEYGIKDNEL
jgi:hypothetical protein